MTTALATHRTKALPTSQDELQSAAQHEEWIVGRVKVLLAHYYQPTMTADMEEAALDDWLDLLEGYSRSQIDAACRQYLSTEPRTRPTPGAILAILNPPKQPETYAQRILREYGG